MIVAGRKPENVTQVHWDDMRQEIIDAATKTPPKIVSEQMRTFAPGKRMESISFVFLNQSI